MPRTVLATLDGSDLSQAIIKYIPAIVRADDVIVLLTVLRYPEARRRGAGYELPGAAGTLLTSLEPVLPAYAEDEGQAIERTRAEAFEYLEDHALFLRNEGLSVQMQVVFDNDAAHGVIEFARELGPLFIAMATHGRGGIDHALHGSVSEQVVRSRVAPVLVIRP
jgi:nucleotide-binding universal stress UspA family protein